MSETRDELIKIIENDPYKMLPFPGGNRLLSTVQFLILNDWHDWAFLPASLNHSTLSLNPLTVTGDPIARGCSHHDEYVAYTIGQAMMCNDAKLYDLCKHSSYFGLLPTNIFKKRFWDFYQQPYMFCFYKALANKFINPIELLWFYGMVYLACRKPKNETSSKILVWMMSTVLKDKFMFKTIFRYFEKKMIKMYSRCYVADLFEIYYGKTYPLMARFASQQIHEPTRIHINDMMQPLYKCKKCDKIFSYE